MEAWLLELIVVRGGGTRDDERRSLSRDVARGLLIRVRRGVYTVKAAYEALDARGRHVVQLRALALVAPAPPVFSHWSAAVLHGLEFQGDHLDRVHVTVQDEMLRGIDRVGSHLFRLDEAEVVAFGPLLATTPARTVVDVAGGGPFNHGVVVADSALAAGLPREMLAAALDLAGPRRARRRTADVIAFAHPGGESAAESESRVTMLRLGVEPPELQHEVHDGRGLAGVVDTWHPVQRAAGEVDGDRKYLDPRIAPDGAGRALVREKRREDRVLGAVDRLGRWGYFDALDPDRLRPVLARMGVLPSRTRPTLADYAASARTARPRRPRHPARRS